MTNSMADQKIIKRKTWSDQIPSLFRGMLCRTYACFFFGWVRVHACYCNTQAHLHSPAVWTNVELGSDKAQ